MERKNISTKSIFARRIATEDDIVSVLNSRASYIELLDCVRIAKKLNAWHLRRMAAERIVDDLNVVGRRSRADIETAANNIVFSIFAEAKDIDSINSYANKCDDYLRTFEKRYPNLGEINKRLNAKFKPLIDKLLILVTDDEVHSLIQISSILRQIERSDLAITSSRRALTIDNTNPVAMTTLGAALTDISENQEAMYILTESLKLNPKSVHAILATSRCHQRLGQYKKSISLAKTAFRLQPESLPTALRLISAAVASKDSMAFKVAKQVIINEPKSVIKDERWLNVLSGLIFCELGNFSEAEKIYNHVAKSHPTGDVFKKLKILKHQLDSVPSDVAYR